MKDVWKLLPESACIPWLTFVGRSTRLFIHLTRWLLRCKSQLVPFFSFAQSIQHVFSSVIQTKQSTRPVFNFLNAAKQQSTCKTARKRSWQWKRLSSNLQSTIIHLSTTTIFDQQWYIFCNKVSYLRLWRLPSSLRQTLGFSQQN